jgi:hypothetical protein
MLALGNRFCGLAYWAGMESGEDYMSGPNETEAGRDGTVQVQLPHPRAEPGAPPGAPAGAPASELGEAAHYGIWRQEVLARARRIGNAPVRGGRRGPIPELTGIAQAAAQRRGSLRTWWDGSLVERAWLALHDAEAEALSRMTARDALLWWQGATGSRLRAGAPGSAGIFPPDAATAAASLRAYYDQSDRLYEQSRALRNRLICLTVIGIMITGLLLSVGALGVLRVSAGPSLAVAGAGQFLAVALFGVIGAFISGLPALSRRSSRLSSYWTGPYQMALKLAVGPVFALLGVLTLEAGFVDQARPFSRFGSAVLLWAVIFGSAQQLVTGLLDRKASGLAEASSNSADPRQARGEGDPADCGPRSHMYMDMPPAPDTQAR